MRAKVPDQEGYVDRDGVKLHYEIYGDGPDTIVFVPAWSIAHARIYKAQLPYFSERFRCVTYDGRGNGKSDRPDDVAAYSLNNFAADALAVMDATGTDKAILVGLSFGGLLTCILAAYHPERVNAAVLAGTRGDHRARLPLYDDRPFPGQIGQLRRVEQIQPGLLVCELSRFCGSLRAADLFRSSLHQANRGRCRLGERYHGSCAGQDRRGRAPFRRSSTSARPCIARYVVRC